jgi:hypothetical protein
MKPHTMLAARMNGLLVRVTAYVETDGVIQYWKTQDPETGAHVDLSSGDKFYVLGALQHSLRMRGAA